MDSIFKQYERVIVESLITSFGLDFLVNDRHGGDVDTIHNVRQIGKDEEMMYKSKVNQHNYENRGDYNSDKYHKDERYKEKNREISKQKEEGTLIDAYTGEKMARNAKSDLDGDVLKLLKSKNQNLGALPSPARKARFGRAAMSAPNPASFLSIATQRTRRSKEAKEL